MAITAYTLAFAVLLLLGGRSIAWVSPSPKPRSQVS
jgi:hypothetical protein